MVTVPPEAVTGRTTWTRQPDSSNASSGRSPEVFATCEEGRHDGMVTDADQSAGAVSSVPVEAPGVPTPPVRLGPAARPTASSVRERA
ncbi:hypothetical protein ACQEV4_21290 [Streptomyces shenzhenensis]|uniref:hypothetical protein n=1 Tax=Streptomyces shenzhenensis TaxID=943815 RepID=UPI003D8AD6D0